MLMTYWMSFLELTDVFAHTSNNKENILINNSLFFNLILIFTGVEIIIVITVT